MYAIKKVKKSHHFKKVQLFSTLNKKIKLMNNLVSVEDCGRKPE